jgi:tetratricopeptide (TPR) repeat protein
MNNPRSTLIAKRLARIKRAKGNFDAAAEVLRKGLEHNPGSVELHYDLALTIIDSGPDADQREADTLLYHLRRSFTPRDNNLQAQFWYARQLSISGKFDEARPIFRDLNDARVPFREKTEVRGVLTASSGEPLEKVGTVSLWRETWGFIRLADPRMRVFIALSESDSDLGDYISEGAVIRFKLGFTLRGPVAVDPVI